MKNVTPINVRTYKGGKITEPGIYDGVEMDAYHGDICDGPSISSSGIRLIEKKSLEHYFDQSYLNPDREPQEPKPHFGTGKALHDLAEGKANFEKRFIVRPDKWNSWRTDDAKNWRTNQQLDGMVVLAPEDVENLRGMAVKLAAHPTIEAGILHGLVEHSIFWKDPKTGIWLKSRPDVIPTDSNMIVDLKSCADAGPAACRSSIGEYFYHVQLGMAYEGIKATTGREMTDFVLVFIEKTRPFAINHKPVSLRAIEYGRRQLRRAIDKFAVAVRDNVWPGYDDDEVEAGLPDWLEKSLAWQAEKNLLPRLDDHGEQADQEAV